MPEHHLPVEITTTPRQVSVSLNPNAVEMTGRLQTVPAATWSAAETVHRSWKYR
jgi:hypothetical protein